ncbi:hypothetical protein AJ79_03959 [Helicocarpus griseus UAMH5409]|uniref:Uncharacterized protein n=1 Tax=Helicocarpus griseus UAMH5409 TaxID=1447875 RepID=A0A2B7XUV2_9EURO|nr:hypothetical protein AJ79_03959 [Helicocarpus griseus UAMH5409]
MASLIPTINLPFPVLLHALGLTVLGTYLTFTKAPAPMGITTAGLGLAYLFTAYVPIEQNQFLHASVPVRILLAALAAARLPFANSQERKVLMMITLYDLLGGGMVGYSLDRWNGKVAGY